MYGSRCLTDVAWSSKPLTNPLTSSLGIIKTLVRLLDYNQELSQSWEFFVKDSLVF